MTLLIFIQSHLIFQGKILAITVGGCCSNIPIFFILYVLDTIAYLKT